MQRVGDIYLHKNQISTVLKASASFESDKTLDCSLLRDRSAFVDSRATRFCEPIHSFTESLEADATLADVSLTVLRKYRRQELRKTFAQASLAGNNHPILSSCSGMSSMQNCGTFRALHSAFALLTGVAC